MYWSDAGFSHRKLAERAGFPELLVQIRSIIGMTPAEVHLEPFGEKLEFVSKPFSQDAGVPFGIDDFSLKGFCNSVDDLSNLRQ